MRREPNRTIDNYASLSWEKILESLIQYVRGGFEQRVRQELSNEISLDESEFDELVNMIMERVYLWLINIPYMVVEKDTRKEINQCT